MAFYWSFNTLDSSIYGRLNCWPVLPGSVTIKCGENHTLEDQGDGTLYGDGEGIVDYNYGFVIINFIAPYPDVGTDVTANYTPVEGGCSESDCGRCASHYIELDVTAATISGSEDYTLLDAWRRLFEKIKRDIKPIHIELFERIFNVPATNT